jgi:putative membrane protein
MSVRLMRALVPTGSVAAAAVRAAPYVAALLMVSPATLNAHAGLELRPEGLWRAWSFDGYVVLPMAAAMLLYARGLHRVWSTAGPGRGVQRWQARCFAGGMTVLALALVSPLDALGGALFAAHMTQHVLLMGAAAPLIVLGAPLTAMTWALPGRGRRGVSAVLTRPAIRTAGRWLTAPVVAWTLHAAAIWVWHAPGFYSASVTSGLVHAAQHISFMGTAVLFWWAIRDRGVHGIAVIYLFTTAVHSSILGALLAFSPNALYWPYEATAPNWGLSALEDQQIGGFIMWVPAGLVYFGAALALLTLWLRRSEERLLRMQRTVETTARALPTLVVAAACLSVLSACGREAEGGARLGVHGGDPARGQAAIQAFGCGACHEIRGVRGADGRVGPSLVNVASRVYLAGYLPNEPDNLVGWIMNPQAYRQPTAMPNLGVSEQQARDIAAYLYLQR